LTLDTTAQTALHEAKEENIPFMLAFRKDGMATTYTTGESAREILKTVGHGILQLVLTYKPIESENEYYAALNDAMDVVYSTALALLADALSFEERSN